MAKAKSETDSKVKRVRRYRHNADESGMIFTLPSGATREIAFADFHADSTKRALFYGAGQLFQDSLARGKEEAPATDEEANESLDRFASGDWKATRSGGGVTMQSVAATLYKSAYHAKHGKNPDAETLKAGVVKLLDAKANPKGFATVKARFEALSDTAGIEV